MKKGFVLILCTALALSLTGCANTQHPPGKNSSSSISSAVTFPVVADVSRGESPSSHALSGAGEIATSRPVADLSAEQNAQSETGKEVGGMKLYIHTGDRTFPATLEKNAAADAFVEMLQEGPVVMEMEDYSGFEKVGSLGKSLPANHSRITTGAGDIVLYRDSQIVIFYGSNTWSYTRLGRIDDLTGWEEALGSSDVTVTFSIEG